MSIRKPDVVTVLIHRVYGGVTLMRVVTTEYRPTTLAEKEAGHGERIANWTIEPTEEYINSIIKKHDWPPELQAVSWDIVPDDVNEGVDHHFRNAWKKDGKKIGIDMVKARDIHRENLRRMRYGPMEKLDVDYQRADEVGDIETKIKIAKLKQELRDVTKHPDIENAQTPEELKKVIPDILKR